MTCDLKECGPTAVPPEVSEEVRVLPIPAMLDSGAAVLLHLLLQGFPGRTIVLDAAALRAVGEVGALLLASSLMTRSRWAPAPRIVNLSYSLQQELSRHPLRSFFAGSYDLPLYASSSPATVAPS